ADRACGIERGSRRILRVESRRRPDRRKAHSASRRAGRARRSRSALVLSTCGGEKAGRAALSMTNRLFGALKSTMRGAREPAISARSAIDEALLWSTHEQATKAAASAISTAQSAGATAAQQRSALDAAADHSRLLIARGRDLRTAAERVREALERAKL